MIGWIIVGVIVLIIVIIIIKKAKKNYSYVRASGGNTSGVGGFLSACCGRNR
jgi:uncharacterized membrane protein